MATRGVPLMSQPSLMRASSRRSMNEPEGISRPGRVMSSRRDCEQVAGLPCGSRSTDQVKVAPIRG
jgi:hypothetical protein